MQLNWCLAVQQDPFLFALLKLLCFLSCVERSHAQENFDTFILCWASNDLINWRSKTVGIKVWWMIRCKRRCSQRHCLTYTVRLISMGTIHIVCWRKTLELELRLKYRGRRNLRYFNIIFISICHLLMYSVLVWWNKLCHHLVILRALFFRSGRIEISRYRKLFSGVSTLTALE